MLDTNILIAANRNKKGPSAEIVERAIRQELMLFTSEKILAELRTALTYPKLNFPQAEQERFFKLIEELSTIVKPEKISVCRDPDDDKFIGCAIAADATIITGDKDLLALKEAHDILTIREFLGK